MKNPVRPILKTRKGKKHVVIKKKSFDLKRYDETCECGGHALFYKWDEKNYKIPILKCKKCGDTFDAEDSLWRTDVASNAGAYIPLTKRDVRFLLKNNYDGEIYGIFYDKEGQGTSLVEKEEDLERDSEFGIPFQDENKLPPRCPYCAEFLDHHQGNEWHCYIREENGKQYGCLDRSFIVKDGKVGREL